MIVRLAARLPFFYGWVIVAVAFVTTGVGVDARTAPRAAEPPVEAAARGARARA